MKRLLATILALLVLACPALGEPARTATLRFSSFAGGGYEYTVEIDDPSIVRCEAKYEYEEQDEPIDGASFDFTATFTGLKPGSTWATVFGKSPIMENEDSIYSITVDDALNVTLSPVRMISTFYLSRMIEGGFASYKIIMDSGGYRVSIDEGEERPFSIGAVEELVRVIDTYDITSWDGFSESDYNVLDGESFRLDIGLTDGARVLARGENAFPDSYDEAMEQIWRILTWNTEGDDMKLFINGTEVSVVWEDNASVEALRAMLPLTIQMSMYGGFEQVGPIGASLPRNDEQTTTDAGDIVLYSGNQIVIFYGSNTWAYTQLGHVKLPSEEMAGLLENGDVEIQIAE